MTSTWLLVKTQRRGLMVGASICFVIQFLLGFELDPTRPKELFEYPAIALMFAMLVNGFAGFHTNLFKLPFPITNRQLAWVPSICMAITWLSGYVGIFSAIFIRLIVDGRSTSLEQWVPLIFGFAALFPVGFLCFVLYDRAMRFLGMSAVGFASITMVVAPLDSDRDVERFFAMNETMWPFFFVSGLIILLTAPADVRSLDFPSKIKTGLMDTQARTKNAPIRTTGLKALSDVLTALVIIPMMFYYFDNLSFLRHEEDFLDFFTLLFAGGVVYWVFITWRVTCANGFSHEKTMLLFLMKCTLVLIPVAWWLGAKRGAVATCEECGRRKFMWAEKCPNCQHENPGVYLGLTPSMPFTKRRTAVAGPRRVSTRMFYRVMLPIWLIVLCTFGMEATFDSAEFTIHLKEDANQEVVRGLFNAKVNSSNYNPAPETVRLKEALNDVEDASSWVHEQHRIGVPEKFRIEFDEYADRVKVKTYSLLWEHGDWTATRIRDRVLEIVPESDLVQIDIVKFRGKGRHPVNRLTLSSFLDNDIHWRQR